MSFLLKGGYDVFSKNIINVYLKKTTIWNRGAVMVNGVKFNIDSNRDNEIEMIRYDDVNSLMVNNAIIYENRRLFTYDIDLNCLLHQNDFSKKNLYNYIDFKIIKYNDIKNIYLLRTTN